MKLLESNLPQMYLLVPFRRKHMGNKNIDLKRSRSLFISDLIFTGIGVFIAHQVVPTTMGNLSILNQRLKKE